MYPYKLHGDRIDPVDDFIGAVANRSKLSVCTLPPLHPVIDEKTKMEIETSPKTKRMSQQFMQLKKRSETEPIKQRSVSMPKIRNSSNKNLFSKIGKRISSIGNLLEKNSAEETNFERFSSDEDLVDFNIKLTPETSVNEHQVKSEIDHKIPLQRMKPQIRPVKRVVSTPLPKPKPEKLDNASVCSTCELSDDDNEDKNVYIKNNQLYLNMLDSSESLVTQLLNTYSTLDTENSTSNVNLNSSKVSARDNFIQLANFESPASARNNHSTYTKDQSMYTSTKATSDLFSIVPSYCSEETERMILSTDSPNFHRNNDTIKNMVSLYTTNYNKKLPPTPISEIKKNFQFANTSPESSPNSYQSFKSSYESPVTTESSNDDDYYDCPDFLADDFAQFHDSPKFNSVQKNYKTETSPVIGSLNVPKKRLSNKTLDQQQRCKSHGDIKYKINNIDNRNEKMRAISYQYMKSVGIQPHMLNGYQN